jgi:hypothetical protein
MARKSRPKQPPGEPDEVLGFAHSSPRKRFEVLVRDKIRTRSSRNLGITRRLPRLRCIDRREPFAASQNRLSPGARGTHSGSVRIRPVPATCMLAGSYARAGDAARVRRIVAQFAALGENARAKASMHFHLVSGEFERAADCLEKLIEKRDPDVVFVNCQSTFRNAREYPRIHKLLLKMNLANVALGAGVVQPNR